MRGAGPLRQRARRRVAGRVLLVGDAAGYVDALTGEGLALAFAQAEAAVAALSRRPTRRRYEDGLAPDRAPLPAADPGAAGRHRRRAAAPRDRARRARALPRVFAGAVNELARPVGPLAATQPVT